MFVRFGTICVISCEAIPYTELTLFYVKSEKFQLPKQMRATEVPITS